MDSWLSPNHKSYVAITVHLEHAGKPLMMLLNLVEMAKSHTGVNLGITFASILKNFGIEDKVSVSNIKSAITHLRFVLQILSITGNNASNNDTIIQYLGDALNEFPGPANQTRCFVHTVNLVVKAARTAASELSSADKCPPELSPDLSRKYAGPRRALRQAREARNGSSRLPLCVKPQPPRPASSTSSLLARQTRPPRMPPPTSRPADRPRQVGRRHKSVGPRNPLFSSHSSCAAPPSRA